MLIGIRRAGKSTHLKDFLTNSVSDKTLVCYLDFADDRLVDLQHEEPGQITDAYYQLHVI
ncbi:MAG: hypothetical protein IKO57_14140 [Treponema sp.]|nr:hypothetical protein [Treponema sp.]